jgi:hypothetical protein
MYLNKDDIGSDAFFKLEVNYLSATIYNTKPKKVIWTVAPDYEALHSGLEMAHTVHNVNTKFVYFSTSFTENLKHELLTHAATFWC